MTEVPYKGHMRAVQPLDSIESGLLVIIRVRGAVKSTRRGVLSDAIVGYTLCRLQRRIHILIGSRH